MKKVAELRERYPTLKHLAADYNPSKSSRYAMYPTRCVCGTAPVLADVKNAYGDNAATQWLIAQIVAFQESINTPNKMMPSQYAGLAETISQEFHFLKTTDIILFLNHLAAGRFNVDFHGYVTPDVILEALRTHYLPYRALLIDKELQEREKENKEKDNDAMPYADYLKMKQQQQKEQKQS